MAQGFSHPFPNNESSVVADIMRIDMHENIYHFSTLPESSRSTGNFYFSALFPCLYFSIFNRVFYFIFVFLDQFEKLPCKLTSRIESSASREDSRDVYICSKFLYMYLQSCSLLLDELLCKLFQGTEEYSPCMFVLGLFCKRLSRMYCLDMHSDYA